MGGTLTTDDKALADRARYLATHAREPMVHYEWTDAGCNYRMSNLLAALGRAQVSYLNDTIGRRKAVRRVCKDSSEGVPGATASQVGKLEAESTQTDDQADGEDNSWLTAIVVDPEAAGWAAADLGEFLRERNASLVPCGNRCTRGRRSETKTPRWMGRARRCLRRV